MITEYRSVVVAWHCKYLNQDISCDSDAIQNKKFGWFCDCRNWTFGVDDYHSPMKHGIREVADCEKLISDSGNDVKNLALDFDSKQKHITHRCEVCGSHCCMRDIRWIHDVGQWICYSCYTNKDY